MGELKQDIKVIITISVITALEWVFKIALIIALMALTPSAYTTTKPDSGGTLSVKAHGMMI
jgi:hypothetical protein